MVFVATGQGKAEVLHRIFDRKEDFPAGRVKPVDGKLYWLIDGPAGKDLITPPLVNFKL